MLRTARYCYGKVVCVRPSVTLRYHDRIGWNSSKIISLLVSLGCSLVAHPTSRIYSKGNTLKFLTGIGEGYRKSSFWRNTITLKHSKIGPRLLLRTNRKSYTRFRLVQKSTSDDLLSEIQGHWYRKCRKIDKCVRDVKVLWSKIIPQLFSLVFSVCRDHNIMDQGRLCGWSVQLCISEVNASQDLINRAADNRIN